jgi:hypothetical protein
MTRGILIAGNESSLSSAIAVETANRVEHFAVAFIPNRFPAADTQLLLTQSGLATPVETPVAQAQIPLRWNPGSPVSARALILATENRRERIDDASLVCSPPSLRKHPTALTSTEVEIMMNDHIKGWFFLVKELAAIFKAKKAGTLALVLAEQNVKRSFLADSAGPDLVGSTVLAAFRAFTQSLLDCADDEPFQVMGFTAPEASDTSAVAAFIFKTIEEGNKRNNGKLHRFGKTGFNFFGR